MIKIDEELSSNSYDAKLLLQIHDELVFEARDSITPVIIDIIKTCMENVIKLQVDIPVRIYVGTKLGSLTEYKR